MQAAAHTKGGYGGVPQAVGEEFVGPDRVMVEDESEDEREKARGKLSERDEAVANKTPKEREDEPADVFLEPGERKYPVREKRDGEWKYDRELLLAAAREARMHGHDDLAEKADAIRKREFGGAMDSLALDRASVRQRDANGFLRIEVSNISKANVCPYLGNEIPDYQRLGLDPQRVYNLLRDPKELEAAAATFNGVPLLNRHIPVTVENPPREAIVGSLGSDAEFDAPYLRNSLTVWDAGAIDGIENDEQRELSCGYRYEADMTPGVYEGVKYDGVMRNLKANHVALVSDGRAGSDVVVGDSKPSMFIQEQSPMAKVILSRKAALAKGALSVYLAPKLAQDSKLNFGAILKDVTAKNFTALKPKLVERITAATKDKMAQDATLDDLTLLLDTLDRTPDGDGQDPGNLAVGDTDDGMEEVDGMDAPDLEAVKAALKGMLSPEDHAKICEMLGGAPAAMDEGEPPKKLEAGEPPVTKQAMDAAIAEAQRKVEADTIARLNAVREAERDVRPIIGEIAIAQDSAAGVYRLALDSMGIDHKGVTELTALKALVGVARQRVVAQANKPSLAQDAAAADAYAKRFPAANRLRA